MNFLGGRLHFAAMRVGLTIGAAFWFEWRIKCGHLQAEPRSHVSQDVIGEKAQTIGNELNCSVSVSEVISGLCNQKRVATAGLKYGFVGRHNLNISAIRELHPLSASQQPAALHDERGLFAVVQAHEQSALATLIEGQVNTIPLVSLSSLKQKVSLGHG